MDQKSHICAIRRCKFYRIANLSILLFPILFATIVKAQDHITLNPDSAIIVTSDIDHFWQAFDQLEHQNTTADSLHIIKTIFVDSASEGLRSYMRAAKCYEQQYLISIREKKAAYLRVRQKTEEVAGKKEMMRMLLRKFKKLYPSLRLPVFCFTIGKFEVGGTQFENILYIGCEKDLLINVDILAQTIHELAHFQQRDQNPVTTLDLAMIEGGAEYVSYQVTGKRTIPEAWVYGVANESLLWKEFRPSMDSAIDMKWFLDEYDPVRHRPGSLGYFVGFRICESYLPSQRNKESAFIEIVEMENPKKIFQASSYEKK